MYVTVLFGIFGTLLNLYYGLAEGHWYSWLCCGFCAGVTFCNIADKVLDHYFKE